MFSINFISISIFFPTSLNSSTNPLVVFTSLITSPSSSSSIPFSSETNDKVREDINTLATPVEDWTGTLVSKENCCCLVSLKMSEYLAHSKYLSKLNNERPNQRNSILKARFTSLHNLVLVMLQGVTVVIPKESCWFGYYPEGASTPLLRPQQTKLYTEDWIGLKTLDAAGKVKLVSVLGKHLQMAQDDIVKYVVPYLKNQPTFFLNVDSTAMQWKTL